MFLSEEHSWPFRSVSEFSVSICSSPRTGLAVGKHHKKFHRPLSVFGSSNIFTRNSDVLSFLIFASEKFWVFLPKQILYYQNIFCQRNFVLRFWVVSTFFQCQLKFFLTTTVVVVFYFF